MNINTTRFGDISIDEENIIRMPYGMLGFTDRNSFVIIEHKADSPFFWYQSTDDPMLAFVIANPFLFMVDYKIDVEGTIKEMAWDAEADTENMQLYIVVNIPKDDPQRMTGNLLGPLCVNHHCGEAVQMVISSHRYSHRCPLLQEKPA